MDIFNIMVVIFGKCRCKSKVSLIEGGVPKTLILTGGVKNKGPKLR